MVSWAGARGVVPLAAALSVPLTVHGGGPLPERDLLLVVATVVIALTLVVQGLTLGPLVARSGLRVDDLEAQRADSEARGHLARRARDHLDELARREALPDHVLDRLRRPLERRLDQTGPPADVSDDVYRAARRRLIAVERQELARLYRAGAVDERSHQRLQHALDLEDAALDDR